MDAEIGRVYGNRLRVRACGLCWHEDKLLMVQHSGLGDGKLWSPPGGGIEFGNTAYATLIQEFEEETKIKIEPGRFLFACEYISPPLHALEFFFEVFYTAGEISPGFDPEMTRNTQIIRQVQWLSSEQIKELPPENLHGIFKHCAHPQDLMKLTGYWQI